MPRELPDDLLTAIREGKPAELNDLLKSTKLTKKEFRDCFYGAVLYNQTNIATTLLQASDFIPQDKRCPQLYMAALTGNLEIVAALLEKLVEIDRFLAPFLLELAVRRSSAKVLELILDKGISVHTPLRGDFTSLHVAVQRGDVEVCDCLLKRGGDVNLTFGDSQTDLKGEATQQPGRTLLNHAVASGNEAMVSLLLKHNAETDTKTRAGLSPLQAAIEKGSIPIAKLLVQAGADVNAPVQPDASAPGGDSRQPKGQDCTLLQIAVSKGREDVVKFLLESKARVEVVDDKGRTPIDIAAEAGHVEMVKLLLNHMPTPKTGTNTPLHDLASRGNVRGIETVLRCGTCVDHKNNNGRTALFLAAKNGHEGAVRVLLQCGADMNYRNEKGWTPLHFLATGGVEVGAECLLGCGAVVDPRDAKGRTPLYFAAQSGQVAMVQLLLRYGADIDAADAEGSTPLSVAALKGETMVVVLLLKCGANPRSKAVEVALFDLIEKAQGTLVKILLDHGARFSSRTSTDRKRLDHLLFNLSGIGDVEIVSALIKSGGNVNSTLHPEKQTPLFCAAIFNREEVLKELLEAGADVNQREIHGETPLLHAIPAQPFKLPGPKCLGSIKILLEYGAQPDAGDYSANRNTPLSMAAEKYWSPELLRILLEYGPVDAPTVRETNMNFLFYTVNKYGPICHMVPQNIPSHGVSSAEILVRHSIKMKAAKLYTGTDNFRANTFSKAPVLKDILIQCKKEVSAMKKELMGTSNTSFYDILVGHPYKVARLITNGSVAKELNSGQFKKLFPSYANNLDYQFEKGKVRNGLLVRGVKICHPAFKKFADVPAEVVKKILDYLSNADLRAVIQAQAKA